MNIDLSLLQCPLCLSSLRWNDNEIQCDSCRQCYSFYHSIPNFVPSREDVEWVKKSLHYQEVCNIYFTKRIKEKNGWWLLTLNDYKNIRNEYNLNCGRIPVIDKIGNQNEDRSIIIDIGGGDGYVLRKLEEKYPYKHFYLLCIDLSTVILEDGKQRNPRSSAFHIACDCLHLAIRSNITRSVICSECIEHMCEVDLFINKVYRILRSNGLFLITTPNRHGLAFWLSEKGVPLILNVVRMLSGKQVKKMGIYEHIISTKEINQKLLASGFEIVDITHNQYLGEIFFAITEKMRLPIFFVKKISSLFLKIEVSINRRKMIKKISKFIGFNQVIIARKI